MSDILLKSFDPSLLQNVILVVVAIFIPFSVVFLTDILNSGKKESSKLEKTVLIEEVMEPRKFFLFSIIGIVFFTLFEGKDINNTAKILALLMAAGLTYLFWLSFKKILDFSEGNESDKSKFFISFFEKLKDKKVDKQIEYWDYFWSEKKLKEREFTEIFISHIDYAIELKDFDLTWRLAEKTYVENIEKRDNYLISTKILPEVFKWHELLLLEKKGQSSSDGSSDSNRNFLRWDYFGREFFPAVIKALISSWCEIYLFEDFKKHIEEKMSLLDSTKDDKEKFFWNDYIKNLFHIFCRTLFDKKNDYTHSYKFWRYIFSSEWKKIATNKDYILLLLFLDEFLGWPKGTYNKEVCDKDSNMIKSLFPEVHSRLFTVFLILPRSSDKIEDALEKKPNFYINKELEDHKNEKKSQEETIQIILKYFLNLEDIKKRDFKNLIDSNSKQSIEKGKLKKELERLKEMKKEIESPKIKEICKASKEKESRRKDFLELVDLLIKNLLSDRKLKLENKSNKQK